MNQVADVNIDKINRPERPLPSGRVSIVFAKRLGTFMLVMSIILNVFVGLLQTILAVIGTALAIYYSFPPVQAKRKHWTVSVSWQALARGLFPPIYLFSFVGYNTFAILFAFLCTAWVFAFQSTKDFYDIKGDSAYGIKTLPVEFGTDGATRMITYLATIPLVLSLVFWALSPLFTLLTAVMLITFYGILTALILEKWLVAWKLYYAGLGAIYLVTFISLVGW